MLDQLKSLFARLDGAADDERLAEDELRAATAALLAHAAAIDGHIAASERRRLETVLQRHFDLSAEDARKLVGEGLAREREAVDIYSFTHVLQQRLDQPERQHIVELMWEIVAADGEVHPYEANLVWRAAELIGVSTRDRVLLRQEVFARRGITGRD